MINKIKKYDLCLGCGLCASILGKDKCTMKLEANGFYAPVLLQRLSNKEQHTIKQLCPSIHIETKSHKGVWGSMKSICEAWSTNSSIRFKAASGGVVTSLAIFLIEEKMVDAVLQVGVCKDSYLYNELKISRTKEQIVENAQSRYAPALVFHQIKEILESSQDTYAFVGKPCDMAAMQNFIREFPQYEGRIKYYISIFCAGMPSYNATIKTWQQSGHTDNPISLKYRGDGWPGYFKANFSDGSSYQISYNESWGTVLNRHLGFRCKICPDGIGMLADIAVGDSWATKDGYPDFTESEGKCFCMVRTDKGVELMGKAEKAHYIQSQELNIDTIAEKQAYQFNRRKLEGWRLLPVQIVTGCILRFKGLAIWKQAMTANFKEGLNNARGTFSRMRKIAR